MKRIAALVSFPLFLLACATAAALTVEPLPGVAGQSAAQSVFFAVPAAVKVTDSTGQPVAGASVHFAVVPYDPDHGAIGFPGSGFAFMNDYYATTDAGGVASTGPGAFGFIAGPSGIIVEAASPGPLGPEQATVTIPLTVVAGGTASFKVVSGNHQKAPVGTAYAKPWVVQALDANRNPVPFAAVFFYATEDMALPSLFFNGDHDAWVRADANGVATSPIPVANLVVGTEEGFASTLNYQVSVLGAFFDYTNTAPSGGGVPGEGCGRQGKGNGDCGNSPAHSGGKPKG